MIIIKRKKEIEGIKRCCLIIAEIFQALKRFVEPGISTWDIDMYVDDIIKKNHAKSAFKGYSVPGLPPYPASICASVNSCIVHGIPNKETILVESDIISIDVGVTKDGYFGDAARTYPVGLISETATNLLAVTQEALAKGISQAKEGNRVGDISNAIGTYVKQNGYYVADNLTGHGVGKSLHEDPMIPNDGPKGVGNSLLPGMTLAIEPMVNIGTNRVRERGWEFFTADGSLSAHFENTILITDGEPIILSQLL